MKRFRNTVPCTRPAEEASTNVFGNEVGAARAVVEFTAAFFPPTTMAGSQIVDGVLRETTVTKPTLMVEPLEQNEAAFEVGAIVSGDDITVDGGEGWQVDGDPAKWANVQSGKVHVLVIELRKTVG